MKKNRGITLIALVITIVVILILSAIVINLMLGENGIIGRTKSGVEAFNKAKKKEQLEILMSEYQIEKISKGMTIDEFLQNKGYVENNDYEKDGNNIIFYEDGYATTVNYETCKVEEPVTANKLAKMKPSKKIVEPNEELTVSLELGKDVDIAKCKYLIVKKGTEVTKEDIINSIEGTTINIPTTNIGEYTVYMIIGYKDDSESIMKHIDVSVGKPVTSITLNKDNSQIYIGSKETLEVKEILPNDATDTRVEWSSSNTSIATVNANTGEVTGIAQGTATIKATAKDGSQISASCLVTIVKGDLSSISVSGLSKTTYIAGDQLDLTGITVTATYVSGYQENVTSSATFSLTNGTVLSTSNTQVTATYTEGGITKTGSISITVQKVELSSIAVTTPPTKTSYLKGDSLNMSGIVVTATMNNKTTKAVTSSVTYTPTNGTSLSTSNTSVTISYTEDGITKTTTQAISVIDNRPATVTDNTLGAYGYDGDKTTSERIQRTTLYLKVNSVFIGKMLNADVRLTEGNLCIQFLDSSKKKIGNGLFVYTSGGTGIGSGWERVDISAKTLTTIRKQIPNGTEYLGFVCWYQQNAYVHDVYFTSN